MLLLFAGIHTTCYCQDIQWEKSYGGRHADYLTDVQPTADYGFILAGSSLSEKTGNKDVPGMGDLDYWIWKMDENGELDWQKSFGGTGSDMLKSIKLTIDGGFILAGTSSSDKGRDKKDDSHGANDFWVIKLDAAGGEQWQKTIGGKGQDDVTAIIQTRDGGYLIGGSSSSPTSGDKSQDSKGNLDYWIVKLDAKGTTEWQKTYGGEYVDILRSMEQVRDGGYILGGYSNSSDSGDKTDKNYGVGDYWILRLDNKGAIVWQKTYGGDKDDQLYTIYQLYDGNFIVGGNSNSGPSNNKKNSNSQGTDLWVLKLDTDGNALWQETYNFGQTDILTGITENDDHTLLIAGYAQTEGGKDDHGINDYVALKIDEKGEEKWRKIVGSAGEDILRRVVETRDGGYLLAGTSDPEKVGKNKRRKSTVMLSGIQTGNIAAVDRLNRDIDNTVQDGVSQANDFYKEQTRALTDKAKDAIGKDSPVKIDTPVGNVLNANSKGGFPGQGSSGSQRGLKPGVPASRDKSSNYGGKDFWVVKLKDKQKPEEAKRMVEAIPNPAGNFTNIIVGYDYKKGWATLYDLSGHQIQRFKITDRTIALNLSGLPEGVYIVQIGTDEGTNSVKIIKGITTN